MKTRNVTLPRRRLRRRLLRYACGVGAGLPWLAHSQSDPNVGGTSAPPQENDWLVFAFGEREGQIMRPEDFDLGGEQVFAYPQDAATGETRNGTRLNQIIVVRISEDTLSESTRARAVGGIVAYSGVCSHTGCDVTDWNADFQRFQCPCHESQFDPSDAARVVGGPAPWQLAALPLKLVDGKIAARGPFEGRIGFQQPGLDRFGLQL